MMEKNCFNCAFRQACFCQIFRHLIENCKNEGKDCVAFMENSPKQCFSESVYFSLQRKIAEGYFD